MTAAELLARLRTLGVRLEANGDRLRVDAPRGALTPELRAALAQHKPELVRLLSRPVPRCRGCGAELQHHHVGLCQECTWSEGRAWQLLREALRRCAEAYGSAGPLPLPDLGPYARAVDEAWARQDMSALRTVLGDLEAAVRKAVEQHHPREEVA